MVVLVISVIDCRLNGGSGFEFQYVVYYKTHVSKGLSKAIDFHCGQCYLFKINPMLGVVMSKF